MSMSLPSSSFLGFDFTTTALATDDAENGRVLTNDIGLQSRRGNGVRDESEDDWAVVLRVSIQTGSEVPEASSWVRWLMANDEAERWNNVRWAGKIPQQFAFRYMASGLKVSAVTS